MQEMTLTQGTACGWETSRILPASLIGAAGVHTWHRRTAIRYGERGPPPAHRAQREVVMKLARGNAPRVADCERRYALADYRIDTEVGRAEDSARKAPVGDHDTPFIGRRSTSPASREAADTSAARSDLQALHCQFHRQILELDVPASMFDDPETLPDWMTRRET